MKIALFSNSYLPYQSGITISIKILKTELRALGHTVYLVGPRYPGYKEHDPQIFRLLSFPATYPGYRFVFPYSPKVFAHLKEEKIDIIHAHQPFGVGLSSLLLARRMGIPFVYSFHTLFSRYVHHAPFVPQKWAKRIVSSYLTFFCQQADTVIVPSEMVRRLLALRKVKTPVAVIPTGLKLNMIKERHGLKTQRTDIRKKHGLPAEAKILLYSGRLSEEKNVPFLLRAFEKIKLHEKNVYLILVGGGPKGKEYEQMAGSNVLLTGQIPHVEVIDHCLAADIFVYASTSETQGLVITEAKACGLPVVAVFGGGVSDVVENAIDGYLLPQNQDVFIDHVLRLLKNDALRKEMSNKANEDAHNRFCSKVVAKQVENVYNSLINPSTKLRIDAERSRSINKQGGNL